MQGGSIAAYHHYEEPSLNCTCRPNSAIRTDWTRELGRSRRTRRLTSGVRVKYIYADSKGYRRCRECVAGMCSNYNNPSVDLQLVSNPTTILASPPAGYCCRLSTAADYRPPQHLKTRCIVSHLSFSASLVWLTPLSPRQLDHNGASNPAITLLACSLT